MTKILVVDDDGVVRDTITQLLEDSGYVVVCAEDGLRGLRAFRIERPDLVITDIIMPQTDGIRMIMEMRTERPDARIIAVSGGGRIGSADFLKVAREFGAAEIIAKPFDADDFLGCVSRCLGTA